jgi:hypothetical protein
MNFKLKIKLVNLIQLIQLIRIQIISLYLNLLLYECMCITLLDCNIIVNQNS